MLVDTDAIGSGETALEESTPSETTPITPAPETQASETAPETVGEEGKKADAEVEVDLEALKAANRGIARERNEAKKHAKALEEENARLRQAPERESAPPGKPLDAGGIHPRLKGLKYDPVEELVEMEPGSDTWFPKSVALSLARAEALHEAQETSTLQQERTRVEERRETLGAAILDDVETTRAKVFPNLPESVLPVVQDIIVKPIGLMIRETGAFDDPDQLPADFNEMVTAAIKEGVKQAYVVIGDLQRVQLTANSKAKEQQPVSTGGKAAMPVEKPYHLKTQEEKDAYHESAFARAQAKVRKRLGLG